MHISTLEGNILLTNMDADMSSNCPSRKIIISFKQELVIVFVPFMKCTFVFLPLSGTDYLGI